MRYLRFLLSLLISFSVIISCNNKKINAGEGYLNVTGGKIWYNVVGNGDKTPLVLLHGGPAYTSYYLNPLKALADERPVIFYDQLGCGRSDRITDTSLMTREHYVEELHELLEALHIKKYFLLGHSWGSMLAVDFYLKYPGGIQAMILGSPCLDAKQWMKDADTLIASLPDSVLNILRNNINGVQQDSAVFDNAVNIYFDHFYNRKHPLSADIDSTNANVGENVYEYMWGKSEFFATGTLKTFDRTPDLHEIKVPTLYTTGEFDAARPATIQAQQRLTPGAKFVIIKNAGHYTMQDNAADNLNAIRTFLHEVESKK